MMMSKNQLRKLRRRQLGAARVYVKELSEYIVQLQKANLEYMRENERLNRCVKKANELLKLDSFHRLITT